jgi:hypothetical protein
MFVAVFGPMFVAVSVLSRDVLVLFFSFFLVARLLLLLLLSLLLSLFAFTSAALWNYPVCWFFVVVDIQASW